MVSHQYPLYFELIALRALPSAFATKSVRAGPLGIVFTIPIVIHQVGEQEEAINYSFFFLVFSEISEESNHNFCQSVRLFFLLLL